MVHADAILLEIEGTTTPVDYVFGVLFPFARAHVDLTAARLTPTPCLDGGESSRVAMMLGVDLVDEVLQHEATTTAIVTHGNLMALILKHFDDGTAEFGYTSERL